MRGDSTGIVLDQISTDDGSLDLAYDTIVGDGTAGSVGVESSTQGFASEGELDMYDSIVRGFAHSLDCTQTSGSSTNLDATYSDFDATTEEFASGCSSTIANNLANLDPAFVVLADGDRTIPYSSPVIGQGDPANLSGSPLSGISTDLLGNPRPGGRITGIGSYDLGAFQYQFTAPSAQAGASPSTITVGTPVSFSASGSSDVNPGDTLGYSWSFDDGATASGASATHAFATAGTHKATLTVTAPDGLQATAQATVTVNAPPPPPPPPAVAPVLTDFTLTPNVFRSKPAKAGHGHKHHLGSTLAFTLSEPATVTITIEHALAGRMSGGSCVRPHKHAHGAKCTRYVDVGTPPAISATQGANSAAFAGSVNGSPLGAGRYQAQLVATAAGRSSPAVNVAFKIVAR